MEQAVASLMLSGPKKSWSEGVVEMLEEVKEDPEPKKDGAVVDIVNVNAIG